MFGEISNTGIYLMVYLDLNGGSLAELDKIYRHLTHVSYLKGKCNILYS